MYADLIIPVPVKGVFTYVVPDNLADSIHIGSRVSVQFGKRKIYAALVYRLFNDYSANIQPKPVLDIIDNKPIVTSRQFEFWNWIKDYYLSAMGEVMNVALPPVYKLSSDSYIFLKQDADINQQELNEREYPVIEALMNQKYLSLSDTQILSGQKKILPLINNLIEKNLIEIYEKITQKEKPAKLAYIYISPDQRNEEKIKKHFDELSKRAYKQLELLISFLHLSENDYQAGIPKKELIKHAKATTNQVNDLVEKGLFIQIYKKISRFETVKSQKKVESIKLNEHQEKVLKSIRDLFQSKQVNLLFGVTSSGKTEIYIKLIEESFKKDQQILYLLPEIALTTQIINRLYTYFGSNVGIYHSKYNEQERLEVWEKTMNRDYKIILGARSAVFLPFQKLGLIIIDEEHDTSYKQFDPSPRYQARDAAIYLAGLHKAKVLLGTATPSVESYFNAINDKYGLAELKERYGGIELPEIEIVDMKKESRYKNRHEFLSQILLNNISASLKKKEQVILFKNRRGFSYRLECDVCHWMPQCNHCDVTLTYHKMAKKLRCHYCGYSSGIPKICTECGNTRLLMKGYGTEMIEEELYHYFPEATIRRMDLDTTRKKNAYQKIINDFENRKIDILVGTQMITKGLDFENVSLVGILNADQMIYFPDFRSHERSFHLMAQVSGRAGRKHRRGKVLIQSYKADHQLLYFVLRNDYKQFFQQTLPERRIFKYPPFYRLIKISLRHKKQDKLNQASRELNNMLKPVFNENILGPEYPLVSRIKQYYMKDFMLKLVRDKSLKDNKKILSNLLEVFMQTTDVKSIRIAVNVDPY